MWFIWIIVIFVLFFIAVGLLADDGKRSSLREEIEREDTERKARESTRRAHIEEITKKISRLVNHLIYSYDLTSCPSCHGKKMKLLSVGLAGKSIEYKCINCKRKIIGTIQSGEDSSVPDSLYSEIMKLIKTVERSESITTLNGLYSLGLDSYTEFSVETIKENSPQVGYQDIIPDYITNEVWKRDKGRCVQCGSQKNIRIDHIVPSHEGGSNAAKNLQLICWDCQHGVDQTEEPPSESNNNNIREKIIVRIEERHDLDQVIRDQKVSKETIFRLVEVLNQLGAKLRDKSKPVLFRTHQAGLSGFYNPANHSKAFMYIDFRQDFLSILFFTGDKSIPGLVKANWSDGTFRGSKRFKVEYNANETKILKAVEFAFAAYDIAANSF